MNVKEDQVLRQLFKCHRNIDHTYDSLVLVSYLNSIKITTHYIYVQDNLFSNTVGFCYFFLLGTWGKWDKWGEQVNERDLCFASYDKHK